MLLNSTRIINKLSSAQTILRRVWVWAYHEILIDNLRLDMCTRLVEIHVYMDLEVIFGVSPGPRSRKNWFHWTSVDPNLEWIDF